MQPRPAGYAVVDIETTGLYNHDRIIEIAIVSLDDRFDVVDEYDTLVDPQRDVGPTRIHGITPSMLSMAPQFEEVAAAVARRIENKVLVAHNIVFENRMLTNEFERLGAWLNAGDGICTLRKTHEKLPVACRSHGVEPPHHHRALSDARATASLLRVLGRDDRCCPMSVSDLTAPLMPRTHRRGHEAAVSAFERLLDRTTYQDVDPRHMAYVDLLDWALDDFIITDGERQQLSTLAAELGLSHDEIAQAHREYFAGMVSGAEKDGVITPEEHACLDKVARALGLPSCCVPAVTEQHVHNSPISPGAGICFTGDFVDPTGNSVLKAELQQLANDAGLRVVSGVTKSKCDLLVAADPNSSSGKARKARGYGKPILSMEQFLDAISSASAV